MMLIRWLRSRFRQSQLQLKQKLLTAIARGDDSELSSLIYRTQPLSDSQLQIPVSLLKKLKSPDRESQLIIAEEHRLGRFMLLILKVPWLRESGNSMSGYYPLLVAKQKKELRIVGSILAWNEIAEGFSNQDSIKIRELSMIWISKVVEIKYMNRD